MCGNHFVNEQYHLCIIAGVPLLIHKWVLHVLLKLASGCCEITLMLHCLQRTAVCRIQTAAASATQGGSTRLLIEQQLRQEVLCCPQLCSFILSGWRNLGIGAWRR
jgi:hypothetical protein